MIVKTLGAYHEPLDLACVYLSLCTLNSVCAQGLGKDNGLFVPCLESAKYFHM